MDTAYGSSQIRRIENWSNALSCEVQALIRRISLVGYDVLVRNQQSSNIFVLAPNYALFSMASQNNPELLHLSTLKQLRTNVQPLSQPKAPTAKKPKKKKIPSSTQPKVSNDSREMNPSSTTTHLQATEELVVTVVPIQSLEASVTAEVQNNQLKAVDTTEVPEKIVEKNEVCSFMLCDLDFEPLSLSSSSLPSCDLMAMFDDDIKQSHLPEPPVLLESIISYQSF
ncbi:hypothetical protein Tco_1238093 [Tanacetum coccineum]